MSSHDISVNKPLSVWNKPIKAKFRDLFKPLTMLVVQSALGKVDGAVASAVDVISAVNFGNDPSGVAWLLIFKSLQQAMEELIKENKELLLADSDNPRVRRYKLGDLPDDPDSLLSQLDWSLDKKPFAINENFFQHPRDLPVLEDIKAVFAEWLGQFGLSEAQARSISDRLPSFFVFALNDQWRNRPEDYKPLLEAFDTPFAKASGKEQAWAGYSARLKKQVDERMFEEAFSLRQVYVPLRGYFEEEVEDEKDGRLEPNLPAKRESQKVVVDLEKYLESWLDQVNAYDAIKVISGGPGSGKSSFAKMFAARQAGNAARRVLFIPLHLFDPKGDLIIAMENFVRPDPFLTHNPLDPKDGDSRLLIIFDGLDELSEQGNTGAEIARQFIAEVQRKVDQFNGGNPLRLKVLISGRELVVQANKSEFRRPQQIITVLPYFIPEDDWGLYKGNEELIQQDQRPLWWEKYGRVSGKGYEGLPEDLAGTELLEITSQPLLNYLIAQSFEHGKIDFSQETNINNIYEDLLYGVFKRRWEPSTHPATKNVKEQQFVRILEEVAVSVWHGDGRKTSVKNIVSNCENNVLLKLLKALKVGAEEGITNLLMAFYVRRADDKLVDEPTFEFTHKSFGEYLAARRIVGVVAHVHSEMKRRQENFDSGYDERMALEYWLKLCGPVAMDEYIFDFVRNEIMLREMAVVGEWQGSLIRLINFVLRNGMPMDRLNPRPTFQEEDRQARNAEEALLCVLNICATLTEKVSEIVWPSEYACGDWITRLRGQGGATENEMTSRCLSYLDLRNCYLAFRDLNWANLKNSWLEGAEFGVSILLYADLREAVIKNTNFSHAILIGVKLAEVDLSEVTFIYNANFDFATLTKANLDNQNLNTANFYRASMEEVSLRGANLENAYLGRAKLNSANLRDANLGRANLEYADLQDADLEGANLKYAYLSGANLEGIKVSDETLRNEYLRRAAEEDSAAEEEAPTEETEEEITETPGDD